MTTEELDRLLVQLILDAETKFLEGAEKSQVNLWRTISKLLDDLKLKNGKIKQTASNLRALQGIEKKVRDSIVTETYKGRVAALIANFDRIGKLNNEYLLDAIEGFKVNETLFEAIRQGAIDRTANSLLGAGIDVNITEPIQQMIRQNVTSGASFFDLREQLRDFIIGNEERLGRLRRWSGQITRDALTQFSRNYTEAISEDLGLEWYFYTPGVVEDSREFCIHRQGQYWHKKEVQAWASLDWQGKIPTTTSSSIFIYVGGYSCLHSLVPVSQLVVPQSDKDRAKRIGLI